MTFFGDAASEEGVFFESMNLAMLKKVPVLFVCENNRYSVCSPLNVRQPDGDLAKRAKAFDMESLSVDGMDFFKVNDAARKAINFVREKQLPFLLECKVERLRAHAGSGDPLAEQYRLEQDLKAMGLCDPFKHLEKFLCDKKILSPKKIDQIVDEVNSEISEAFEFAKNSPLPESKDLEKWIFV